MRNVVCKRTILAAAGIAGSFTPGMLETLDHNVGPQDPFLVEPTQVHEKYEVRPISGPHWRMPEGEAASTTVPPLAELAGSPASIEVGVAMPMQDAAGAVRAGAILSLTWQTELAHADKDAG